MSLCTRVPPYLAPESVTNLRSPYTTPNSIAIQWDSPGGKYDSFLIEYSDEDGVAGYPVHGRGVDTNATLTSLAADKLYNVNLYTVSNSVRSNPVSQRFKTYEFNYYKAVVF